MGLTADTLRSAFGELPEQDDALTRGAALAASLGQVLERHRAESEVVEVRAWAFNVELVLRNGDHWTIECLSPGAFRMYPGGANVWVRETDMDVHELIEVINDVAFSATKEEILNA